ncbi:MAG: methyltransferase domain-containing protein [Candidatus Tantalella remota]|nr:methyltransferase domain-containing protein [Candidatus Tantalella remota]
MIKNDDIDKNFLSEFSGDIFYIRFIRNCLKKFRIWMVLRHLKPADVHIDLGCGDMSLLKVSPCREKFGLDSLHGDYIGDKIDFPDQFADYITLVAFLEHLEDPILLIKDCKRVLKSGGTLIVTTPLKASERFLKLWHKDLDSEHKGYFDKNTLKGMFLPLFEVQSYKKYFLNQVIVCRKT